MRILRLRPVRLCWRSGPITLLFRLLPARPAVGRDWRRSTRLLHYVGRRRILLPGVAVGRRISGLATGAAERPFCRAAAFEGDSLGRLLAAGAEEHRLLHYVGRRRILLPRVGVGGGASGLAAGVDQPFCFAVAFEGDSFGRLLALGRRSTRPLSTLGVALLLPGWRWSVRIWPGVWSRPAILFPSGVRGRLIRPVTGHGRRRSARLLHHVGRRRSLLPRVGAGRWRIWPGDRS